MKNKIKYFIVILIIFISYICGVYSSTLFNSSNILYNNSSGLESTNVQDAIDELYINIKESSCNYSIGTEWEFDYTGYEQTFLIPCSGTYKLETWGAQGGTASSIQDSVGGYGAYAVGKINLENEMLYINVGGSGKSNNNSKTSGIDGGYNGGGFAGGTSYTEYGQVWTGSGGGATHIATSSGLLSTFRIKN